MQENVKLSLKARRNIMGYLFITPAFIFFVGFSVLPIILAVTWSFTNYNGIDKMDFIGFKAYEFAFKDAYFLETFKNIFRYVIIAVPLSIIVPLLLALLLNIDQKGSKAFTAIYYLPGLVSAIAASAIFSSLLDPSFGVVNQLLRELGILTGESTIKWLQDDKLAMPVIAILNIWMGAGGNMVIYLAALKGVPKELMEAATIDGASKVQTFFKVTVPLLRPTTFFILTMSIIGSFQLYDQVLMLTNGNHGTATPVFYIYNMAFGTDGFVGVASAMAVILFFVIMVVTLVMQKFTKETY